MTLGMNIKGLDTCNNNVLFWNGKYAQIYEVFGNKNPVMNGTFESSSTVMALHDDSIFQNKNGKIEILNFQGETKQVVPLSDSDGEITLMEIVGKHMVVVTANNTI